jgi:hypothetical protein
MIVLALEAANSTSPVVLNASDAILIGDYEGRAPVCRQGARRFHAGGAGGGFQAVSGARNEHVPVQEPARGASRSVGRRTDGRGDGEMPLAETAAGSDDRLSVTNGRESPAPPDVHRAKQEFGV